MRPLPLSADRFADHLAPLIIWVEVEPCMALISACLPTLRPILTFLLRHVGLTSRNAAVAGDRPGKPLLVTFGRGGGRQKRNGYATTRSIENDQDLLEHMSGWPEVHHGNRTATVVVGQDDVELNRCYASQPQSIAVRTDVAWNEYRIQQLGCAPYAPGR